MKKEKIIANIENSFRNQVRSDKKIMNAYLLVHSDRLGINLNVAEGKTNNVKANPQQPNHLASVGKLFTATIISILYEKGELDFDERISKYLDSELMSQLHVYKGRDYSEQIKIKHLLMQTSGLNDVFYHLLKKMQKNKDYKPTTREAIIWGKKNLKPRFPPGKKLFYTDTNYYLLGFIIENITKKPFHKVMHELIFEPLKMKHSYMHGFSKQKVKSKYPVAGLYVKGINLLSIDGVHEIDYAGGSVTATLEDYLKFMKALVNGRIIKKETLTRMIKDDIFMLFPSLGFKYGYSIWKPVKIPLLLPKKYFCWGCVGATGAFMFYHPKIESYIIGTFNDFSYGGKALTFMFRKVIGELLKYEDK